MPKFLEEYKKLFIMKYENVAEVRKIHGKSRKSSQIKEPLRNF